MKTLWTDRAVEDLENIFKFIAADDPRAAARTVERLYKSVEQILAATPDIGRPGRVPGTREFIISNLPFIVPYRIRAETLEVLRVFHTARDWPAHFSLRPKPRR